MNRTGKSLHGSRSGGFALIELVIALSVLLIIFPPTLVVFYQIMQLKFRNEGRIVSVYLAQGIAENLYQRRFSVVDDIHVPGTPVQPVSFAATEIQTGVPNPFYNPNFDDYSYQVIVDCVENTGDLNLDSWPVEDCSDADAADYKRVVVRVFFQAFETITLTSLMTDTSD